MQRLLPKAPIFSIPRLEGFLGEIPGHSAIDCCTFAHFRTLLSFFDRSCSFYVFPYPFFAFLWQTGSFFPIFPLLFPHGAWPTCSFGGGAPVPAICVFPKLATISRRSSLRLSLFFRNGKECEPLFYWDRFLQSTPLLSPATSSSRHSLFSSPLRLPNRLKEFFAIFFLAAL